MIHMDHRAAAFSISTIFPSHFHGQGAESLSLHIPKKSVCMISDYIQRDYGASHFPCRKLRTSLLLHSAICFRRPLMPDNGGNGWRLKIR